MKKRLLFILAALALLAPWPIVYAYDEVSAAETPMAVAAADAAAAPKLEGYGNAIGSVTPGDLFYLETGERQMDVPVTLYIVNLDELVACYRYLNLNVGVYFQGEDGDWREITAGNGEPLPDIYITMQSGQASFTLPAGARYRICIDKGCFYSYGTGSAAPSFYLSTG